MLFSHGFKSKIVTSVIATVMAVSLFAISTPINVSAVAKNEEAAIVLDHSDFDYKQTPAYKRFAGEQTYTATCKITEGNVTDISYESGGFDHSNEGPAPEGCNRTLHYFIYVNFKENNINEQDTVKMTVKLPVPYNYVASSAVLVKTETSDVQYADISERGDNYIVVNNVQEIVEAAGAARTVNAKVEMTVHFHEHAGYTMGHDENYHWFVCDKHQTEFFKEAHTFENDKCTVCEYQKITTPSNESSEEKTSTGDTDKEPAASGAELTDSEGNKTGYTVTNSDTASLTVAYEGTAADKNKKSVTIPDIVKDANGNEYKVTEIKDGAFKNLKKVKTITFGKYVTKIGVKAFYGCKNLEKVVINGNVLKTIGKNSFKKTKSGIIVVIKAANKKTANKVFVKINKTGGAKKAKLKYKKYKQ